MVGRCFLLAAAAAAGMVARPAVAQQPLRDVPARHWASGAVGELQSRGIITGYSDGTFGGKRAVTRYEFALVGQRLLQNVQRRLDADSAHPAAAPSGAAADATSAEVSRHADERIRNLHSAVAQLRIDVDQLKGTMGQLQTRAATLRSEVDRMRQQLGDTRDRSSHIRPRLPLAGHR